MNKDDDDDDIVCPECDGPMVLRRKGSHTFWGCAAYPTCRGTRNLDEDQDEDDTPSARTRNNDHQRWRRLS